MRSFFFFSIFAFAAFLGACVPAPKTVARARAANDLACPEANLTTRESVSGTVEVSGCGQRAVYTCPRSGGLGRVCVREAPTSAR
jgi:hypothetical protein